MSFSTRLFPHPFVLLAPTVPFEFSGTVSRMLGNGGGVKGQTPTSDSAPQEAPSVADGHRTLANFGVLTGVKSLFGLSVVAFNRFVLRATGHEALAGEAIATVAESVLATLGDSYLSHRASRSDTQPAAPPKPKHLALISAGVTTLGGVVNLAAVVSFARHRGQLPPPFKLWAVSLASSALLGYAEGWVAEKITRRLSTPYRAYHRPQYLYLRTTPRLTFAQKSAPITSPFFVSGP
jgi:hypothetical protein